MGSPTIVGSNCFLCVQPVVTCMETIKKDMEDARCMSMLVVGAENKQVLILDPTGTTVLKKVWH